MRTSILIFIVCTSSAVIFSGCQDANTQSAKLSRLDAHLSHNLRLELVEKDKQILELQKQIESCSSELEKQTKTAMDCQTKQANEFMEIINPIMDEASKLKEENDNLKAEIEMLKPKAEPVSEEAARSPAEPNLSVEQ